MKVIKTVNLKGFGKKYQGKTRDFYIKNGKRIIVSTDRISAFDRNLGFIPHKGQVLSQLANFWFDKTKSIVDNHIILSPHPNILIVKNAKLIPIEMVVRGYITGVTGTSIWGSYEKGERIIYGIKFPNGLKKNQKLSKPVITPTTHPEAGSGLHDERLTKKEIIGGKLLDRKTYEYLEKISIRLFNFGQKLCEGRGIILVDTKYEFGIHKGKVILVDEIHTPDSSRFWIKKTYKERFKKNLEPENFDKEFLRLWFKNKGYTGEGKPPKMPKSFINKVSKRYVDIFEKITGKKFVPATEKITGAVVKRALN